MNNALKTFKLYTNCIIVKGAKRKSICDVQRREIYFINEGMYEVLTEYKDIPLEEIKSNYCENDHDFFKIIMENYNFLITNELGFFCDNPNQFPDLDLNWEVPFSISNIIIEYNQDSNFLFKNIVIQLDNLGCKFLELRFYDYLHLQKIIKVLEFFNNSKIRNINLFFKYSKKLNSSNLKKILFQFQRIGQIVIFSAPKEHVLSIDEDIKRKVKIINITISSNIHCGIVAPNYFSPNLQHFTESQHHNTCLNRKISIDVNGDIKNCPSMPKSYGNIKDTTLQEALDHPDFKKYWNIKKDEITKCKDCEFRHICTDCRAYRDDPEDIYSAPLKCGYDPYTGKWEEWSNNPLKQKAIDFYEMREIL